MWDYITQIGLIKNPTITLNKVRRSDGLRNSIKEEQKLAEDEPIAHEDPYSDKKNDEARVE